MGDQCELSVIIPIYNGARFLRDTLDSVLRQTYHEYELILVDDGSTDATPDICDEYAQKDKRIRVFHQKNAGMSKARDVGYQMAMPDTNIAFLDGDDIFSPNMFADMMQYKDCSIVQVCSRHVNSDRILRYQMDSKKPVVESMTGEKLLYRYFCSSENSGDIGYLWGMLINRAFYKSMISIIREAESILPQNYLNDVYCVPRLLIHAQKVVLLNKVYILHRISKYTDSRLIKPNALHYELALANKMNLDYYAQIGCSFAYDKQLIGFYLVILKLWYQIVTSETDVQKQKKYINLIKEYYRKYYVELKNLKCVSVKEQVIKWTIQLWRINKTLWRMTVGNMRYGIMYKFQI